jgi:type I restriction enzyme S subunit
MLDQNKNRGDMLPYLANVDVRWGEFDLADLRQMRFESHEMDRYGLKVGDIVMCEGGEPGRCALWKDQIPGLMIQKALHRIRPHDGLDNRFLYYTFLHKGRTGGFGHLFTGATIKHLPGQNLAKLEIDFPEPPDQRAIASILSAYDDAIENNRRRMALLEKAARLLYEEWFVRLRFPGHEHTPVSHGLPQGWERVPFEDALVLQRGFDLPESQWNPGDFSICGSTGIIGNHHEAKAKGPGVFTGRSGSLGVVNYIDDDYWPHNTALWVREFKKVTPLFALFLMREMNLKQYNGGASVPTLDRKAVHRVPVLIPPRKFITLFDEQLTPMFAQLRNLRLQNQKLRAARDLLLPRLMSGEIEV